MPLYRPALASRRRRREAGGVTTIVSDTFTRANSAVTLGSAETGQAWVASLGTCGISSNQAYIPAPGASGANAVVNAGVADCTMQVTLSVFQNGQQGVLGRYTDDSNYIAIFPGGSSANDYTLFKNVAGVLTPLGFYSVVGANGDVLKLVFSGTSIKMFVNGVEQLSVTESHNSTATRYGIRGGASITTARWDNFTVTA